MKNMNNDLISRQAAIEALQNHYEVRNPKQNAIMDECVMLISNVPSAQPERTETHSCENKHTETHDSRREWYMKGYRDAQRWIPFKTRPLTDEEKKEYPYYVYMLDCQLPENGQRILVNVKLWNGHESVQMDEYYDDDGSYLDSGYEIVSEATAWMPLQEPWKGEQESEVKMIFPRRDDATNKELIMTIIDIQGYLSRYGRSHTNWHETLNEVIERLEQAESAPQESKEVPQIMRGRWMPTEPDEPCFYQCSICRRMNDDKDNFCPNCGADMRGTE